MKLLHLGNIANMAYGYSKIMQEYNLDSNVLCYDLKHILSLPETYDSIDLSGKVSGEYIKDEFYSDLGSLPKWYNRIETKNYHNKIGQLPKEKSLSNEWCKTLINFSKRYGKRYALRPNDIADYRLLVDVLSGFFFHKYDLVFAYAYAAVPLLLHAETTYIPIEIGTLRHIPFEDTSFGRLMALSYRSAPHVIITNADTISSAKELELENYSYLPHPIIIDKFDRRTCTLNLRKKYPDTFLLFAPARQDWTIKGNDKYIKAFSELVKNGIKTKLIIPLWGKDVEKSKLLIKDLNIESHVLMIDILTESELTDYYSEVDIVLDQFGDHRTFGLVAPKALAAGAAVLISFNEEIHHWCFAELPPFINVFTEKEIYDALVYYSKNLDELARIKAKGKYWISQYHSVDIIYKKIQSILVDIKDKKNTKKYTLFDSLRQKKLALNYEAKHKDIYDRKYHDSQSYKLMDQEIYEYLKKELTGISRPKILNLGYGPGSMISYLKLIENSEIHAIAVSETMIQMLKEKYPDIQFQTGDADSLPFDDGVFDVVFISDVLHRFPILDLALIEIKRVLKDGGLIFARQPNEKNFVSLYPSEAFAHTCLRQAVSLTTDNMPVHEQELHQYHSSFTYQSLVDQIGKYFYVSNLYSVNKVSYFYDMLYKKKYRPMIQRLEATLANIPGLNIFIVARKDERSGASIFVKEIIQQFNTPKPLSLEYFIETIDFAEKVWGISSFASQKSLANYKLKNMSKFIASKSAKPSLIVSNESSYSDEQVKSRLMINVNTLRKQLSFIAKKMLIIRTVARICLDYSGLNWKAKLIASRLKKIRETVRLPLDTNFNEVIDRSFGSGRIELLGEMAGEKIVMILEKFRESASFIIVLHEDFTIINLNQEQKTALLKYVILDKKEMDDKVTLLVASSICCLVDFYKAMDVALTDYDEPNFKDMKSSIAQKVKALGYSRPRLSILGSFEKYIRTLPTERDVS